MNAIRRDFGAIKGMYTGSRTDLFHRPGQDGFTFAAYLTPHPVSWVGPDGMAFERGEWITVHAYLHKPWRHRPLRDLLLSGAKPDRGARLYWELAGAPIQVESNPQDTAAPMADSPSCVSQPLLSERITMTAGSDIMGPNRYQKARERT